MYVLQKHCQMLLNLTNRYEIYLKGIIIIIYKIAKNQLMLLSQVGNANNLKIQFWVH